MTAYRLPLPAWRSSILHLQYRQECFLRNLDGSYLLHALLARLLLLQQLALARDVTAVALCQHVLAQRLDRLARDDVRTDRRLYRHVEHLTRDQLPHLGNQLAPRSEERRVGNECRTRRSTSPERKTHQSRHRTAE